MTTIEIEMTQDYRDQQGNMWRGDHRYEYGDNWPGDYRDLEVILSLDEWDLQDPNIDAVKRAVDELVFNDVVVFDGDNTAHSGDIWTKSEYDAGHEYRPRVILKGFTAGQLKAIRSRIAQHEQAVA